MKAIRVFTNKEERYKIPNLVEKLNNHEDIAAMVVNPDELVVATTGECTMTYVAAVIAHRFDNCKTETIK